MEPYNCKQIIRIIYKLLILDAKKSNKKQLNTHNNVNISVQYLWPPKFLA